MNKNPIVGASVFVQKNDGSVLLVKRIKDPGKGRWAFPGGIMEYGEKVEHTAAREVEEETNIRVALGELVGVYDIIEKDYHYVTVCYECKPENLDVIARSDAGDARWFTVEELGKTPLTNTTEKALKDLGVLLEH